MQQQTHCKEDAVLALMLTARCVRLYIRVRIRHIETMGLQCNNNEVYIHSEHKHHRDPGSGTTHHATLLHRSSTTASRIVEEKRS
eukprot:10871-Heterococcus_DN1.PRE.4